MGHIKDEEEFINITYLKNSEALENNKKELANLKIKKMKLIEQKQKISTVIKNFQESINYWTTQNNKLKNKIVYTKNQILQLEKQKINKIKNFFITFFSFGQINKNKIINDLIETERKNDEELPKTEIDNEKKLII